MLQRESLSERFTTNYDALGNLLNVGITPLTNGAPQGSSIGTLIDYRVDGQNRRVQRLVNGVADRGWLYRDGLSPVAELDGAGALLNRYVYGTSSHTPDLVVRGGVVHRVIADHLGSIRMIVDATSGAVVQRMDYDAWGALVLDTAPAWQSLGYVSGIQDRETGLVRFGARDYETGVGRWTSKDPAGVAVSGNDYFYCDNDPQGLVDIDGATPRQPARSTDSQLGNAWWNLPWSDGGIKSKVRSEREYLGPQVLSAYQNAWTHRRGGELCRLKYGAWPATGMNRARERSEVARGTHGAYEGYRDEWNSRQGIESGAYNPDGSPNLRGLIPDSTGSPAFGAWGRR